MIYFYIELVLFVLLLVCAPTMLWADYLAVMNIKRVRDLGKIGMGPGLSKWAARVGTYVLIRGYLLDALVNTLHMTALLREWPKWPQWSRRNQYKSFSSWLLKDGELTVSERLKRHINTPGSPHQALCLKLRADWLKDYDVSGGHG